MSKICPRYVQDGFNNGGIDMSHLMMLSDLYGRIGQMLNEYGDAPIGKVESPRFPNEPHTTTDWIKPICCSFHLTTTGIGKIKIKTYEPVMEE